MRSSFNTFFYESMRKNFKNYDYCHFWIMYVYILAYKMGVFILKDVNCLLNSSKNKERERERDLLHLY